MGWGKFVGEKAGPISWWSPCSGRGGFTRLKRVTVEYASSCRIAPYLMHADDGFSARPIFEQSSTLAEIGFQTYLKWVGLTVTPPKKTVIKEEELCSHCLRCFWHF